MNIYRSILYLEEAAELDGEKALTKAFLDIKKMNKILAFHSF